MALGISNIAALALAKRLKNRKLPSVDVFAKDDETARGLEAIKEHLRMYEGDSNNPRERFVTMQELQDAGLLTVEVKNKFAFISQVQGVDVKQAAGTSTGSVRTTKIINNNVTGASTLEGLSDTNVAGVSARKFLRFSGTAWTDFDLYGSENAWTAAQQFQKPLVFRDQSSGPSAQGGLGYLWTKDDTPNSLYFTDDAGTEIPIISGGVVAFDLVNDLSPQLGANLDLNSFDVTGTGDMYFTGTVDLFHTAAEADDHAFEIDCDAAGFGDVKAMEIDYITGAIATGDDESVFLVNIDETLATGGHISASTVLATEGAADKITGFQAGVGVGVVEQQAGTFSDADSVLNKAVDVLAAVSSGGAGNISMWVADNDSITIGDAAMFEELEFLIDTGASGNGIAATWEYSDGVGSWVEFHPVDGTNGFKHTGVVIWNDADVPTWAVGTGSEYLIRITRTRNSLSTTPIVDTIEKSAVSLFGWDLNADIIVNNITANGGTNAQWNSAYGWGDHSTAGYLTSALQNIVEDTTPDLGGDLQSGGFNIDMADSDYIYFGSAVGGDASLYSDGTDMHIQMASGADLRIRHVAEYMIFAEANAAVTLYYNGNASLATQDYATLGNTSAAHVRDHGNTARDVGFNVLPTFNFNASDTLEASHCGHSTGKDNTSAYTLTGPASSDIDFPVGGVCTIMNLGSSGTYALADTATCTMYIVDGNAGTVTDIAGGATVAVGGIVSLYRYSTTAIYLWGSGLA